jgi:hypothetical protein
VQSSKRFESIVGFVKTISIQFYTKNATGSLDLKRNRYSYKDEVTTHNSSYILQGPIKFSICKNYAYRNSLSTEQNDVFCTGEGFRKRDSTRCSAIKP